ncbi:MAG: gliding motility-associated C-terminal domain-containing protein [Bacteroidota bacterium]
MRKLLPLIFLLLRSLSCFGQSNEGTDFWLGFMEHFDQSANTKVLMISSRFATSGTVSMPLLGWNTSFTVAANDVVFVNIPLNAETFGSESISRTGIRVQSQAPVSIYAHQYANFRSEASAILPVNSIGNSYFAMSYFGYQDNQGVHPSEFLIVATEDETSIEITPSDPTAGGTPAGSTISIMLDVGETYQVQALTGLSGDLTGSKIIGDKNFALFSGAAWTEVPLACGNRDNLYEQMYPVSTWGKSFVTVPSKDASFDYYRVLAAEDNTVVFRDGNQIGNLNAGEFVEFSLYAQPSFIEANKGILVAQYNIGNLCNSLSNVGDPSMLLINSVEQTRDTLTLYSSPFEEIQVNYLNIITRDVDQDSIFLDGNNISNEFQTIAGTQDYVYASITVSSGTHTITSSGCGVIATAYGYGPFESYAYSAGASFLPLNASPIPEGGCLNDTIFFSTGLPEDRVAVQWDFGDGSSSSELEPTHIYTALGTYPVEVIIEDFCLNTIDTVNQDLLVTLRQSLEAFNDTLVCENDPVQLGATDLAGARFEWQGPLDYFSEDQFPIIDDTDPNMTGAYSVIGIISGCATFPKEQFVEVRPLPDPALGMDTVICDGGPIPLYAGNWVDYVWQDGSRADNFTVTVEGNYYVSVTDDLGCFNTDSIQINRFCLPTLFVPTAFTPNDDGLNDLFAVLAEDMTQFNLKIFDRWGGLVFQTDSPDEFWNGNLAGGKRAPQGVYVWLISYEEPLRDETRFIRQESGTLTLLR